MTKPIRAMLAIAFYAAAQPGPDLAGIWEWNKSAGTQSGQAPDSMKIKIERQGDAFALTIRAVVRGDPQQVSNRVTVGQETKGEMHGAPMTSRAEWDGAALVIHSSAIIMGKELRTTDRFTVSADGKTLTMNGRSRYGAEPEREEVRVFDRRPGADWGPEPATKPAEEVYKNIQIMKGVPAPRLQTVMMNLTRWLGVECAHCHVMGEFEKDERPAKQTARKMFHMVRAINQNNFAPASPVSCWTCHRGERKPQQLPK